MKVIHARNVNDALASGLWELLSANLVPEASRNGPVLAMPGPVTTVYTRPTERVLLNPARDANPYFHLMEALWMLAGREDLAFPARFNPRMADFSDNGETLHGAYGWRWRHRFGHDQLDGIVTELRRNPASRRCVLSMWDGADDPGVAYGGGKDVPCNTHAYVEARSGALNLTILCRSNDIIWGAYGANAVHFSLLQEYLAARVGVPVGILTQVSCNWHAYLELKGYPDARDERLREVDFRYPEGTVHPYPLVERAELWDADLQLFMESPPDGWEYCNPFFHEVAYRMYSSWEHHQAGRHDLARRDAFAIGAEDWRAACVEWLERRAVRRAAKVAA